MFADLNFAIVLIPVIFFIAFIFRFGSLPFQVQLGVLIFCEIVLVADLFFGEFSNGKLAIITIFFPVGLYRILKFKKIKTVSR
ncbi:MAG: hypothetical protein MUE95_09305 [Cyclobacteriaceae bacterium]|jgi:hypothetical protein|nr:hypothetical protein [Cyclobacteriaceae bacterium]